MKKLFLTLTLLLILSACTDGPPPVDVVAYSRTERAGTFALPFTDVNIIAKVDEIEIQEIIVNRGNCDTSGLDNRLPRTLQFGKKLLATFSASCEVAQVDVETDQGDWTFTFDP